MRPRLLVLSLLAAVLSLGACSKEAPPASLAWRDVRDVASLERGLAEARAAGRAAVVRLTAAWCAPCRSLDRYVDEHPGLRRRLASMALLRIDLTTEHDRPDLRAALGIEPGIPRMIFFRKDGERLEEQLLGWDGRRSVLVLERALSRAL